MHEISHILMSEKMQASTTEKINVNPEIALIFLRAIIVIAS
jgi:hypothetical protein